MMLPRDSELRSSLTTSHICGSYIYSTWLEVHRITSRWIKIFIWYESSLNTAVLRMNVLTDWLHWLHWICWPPVELFRERERERERESAFVSCCRVAWFRCFRCFPLPLQQLSTAPAHCICLYVSMWSGSVRLHIPLGPPAALCPPLLFDLLSSPAHSDFSRVTFSYCSVP